MRPGDPFPSVRALSKALKINPNTAHKVVTQLVAEGVLEVRPGIGTVVAGRPASTAAERGKLLKRELEQLVVEAKQLGLDLDEVSEALARTLEPDWSETPGREEGMSDDCKTIDLSKRFRGIGAGRLESGGAGRAACTGWWGRTARARPPPSRS